MPFISWGCSLVFYCCISPSNNFSLPHLTGCCFAHSIARSITPSGTQSTSLACCSFDWLISLSPQLIRASLPQKSTDESLPWLIDATLYWLVAVLLPPLTLVSLPWMNNALLALLGWSLYVECLQINHDTPYVLKQQEMEVAREALQAGEKPLNGIDKKLHSGVFTAPIMG